MKNTLLKASLALFLAASASGAWAQTMYGITGSNELFTMANINSPSSVSGPYSISGVATGQTLVGLDTRQSNGRLYALGYNSVSGQVQLYTITGSGSSYSANAVGNASSMSLGSTNKIGFNFISTIGNQARITGTNGNSYVLNTDDGSIVGAGTGSMSYASGDIHSGISAVAATSYSNNYYGADAAEQYGYDVTNNVMVKFDEANYYNNTSNYPSTLHTVGLTSGLLISGTSNVGMANWYDNTAHKNTLYLTGSTLLSGGAHLYKMDDLTGLAIDMGAIGTGGMNVNDVAFQTTRDTSAVNAAIQGQVTAALTLNSRNLIFFDSYKPSYIRNMVAIKGMTTGQAMIALAYGYDQRLYGLGYNSSNQTYQLYTIDSASGTVTAINSTPGSINLGNTNSSAGNNSYNNVGFNFIGDAINRIRIIGNNGATNVQLSATTGLIAQTDNSMQYASGDANFGNTINFSSIAYTNGGAGTTTSSMIGYDQNSGSMVTLGSNGYLNTTLSMTNMLNLFANNTSYRNGYMDIYYDAATNANLGYMASNYYGDSSRSDNYSTFYTMNNFTASGTTASQGNIGDGTPVKTLSVQKAAASTGVYTVQKNYNNSLLVYPNPALNNTRIVLDGPAANNVYVDLIDLNGKVINSYQFGSGTYQLDLDLGNIPFGLYSARITSNGAPTQSVKILKQ
ncbi:MAG: DUF4394 domain-containing protein [Flavipsychrobacter sp.]|nr:DUF4394 domain-containing protein [Flavipsychrobacter sp.]